MLLELVNQGIRNLERPINWRILCKEVPHKRIEGELAHKQRLEIIHFRFFDNVVRCYAAATVDNTANNGVLDIILLRGCGFTVVVIIKLRNLGVVALDQTAAGRVPFLSGEREACILAQWVDGLDQTLTKTGLPHD